MNASVNITRKECKRSVGIRRAGNRKFPERTLIGVEIGLDAPGGAVLRKAEAGVLAENTQSVCRSVIFTAEARSVVKHTDPQGHTDAGRVLQENRRFAMTVPHLLVLAPGLLPGLIDAAAGHFPDLVSAVNVETFGFKADGRRTEHGLAVHRNGVLRHSGRVQADIKDDAPVRGGRLQILPARQEGEQAEKDGNALH